jgi:hypothetical protein
MPGPRRRKIPPHKFEPLVLPDHCTEAYVQDWFGYGFELLCAWMGKQAAFADYLANRDHLAKGEQ